MQYVAVLDTTLIITISA